MKSMKRVAFRKMPEEGASKIGAQLPAVQAEAQLRAAGVRVTGARISVLAELSRAANAMTHQALLSALPDMDRVTLYRSLECLIANGLAHRIVGGSRAACFGIGMEVDGAAHELGQPHRHGHFECVRCSKVFCLSQTTGHYPDLQQILDNLNLTLEEGFQSDDIELTIKGQCADCARRFSKFTD